MWDRFAINARNRIREDEGQALVEYSLILLLVALVTITVLGSLGAAVTALIQPVVDAL